MFLMFCSTHIQFSASLMLVSDTNYVYLLICCTAWERKCGLCSRLSDSDYNNVSHQLYYICTDENTLKPLASSCIPNPVSKMPKELQNLQNSCCPTENCTY